MCSPHHSSLWLSTGKVFAKLQFHFLFRFLRTMLVERTSYAWAFADDIPGSRCDAEDGPWPRAYQILENDQVWRELSMLAKPQTSYFDGGFRADSLNFQPCHRTRTQDRYVSRELDIHGKKWVFTGVFDGECLSVLSVAGNVRETRCSRILRGASL